MQDIKAYEGLEVQSHLF